MAHRPAFKRHPSTYPSPTISPTFSLPSLSGSYLLDLEGPMPGTPALESTTGFEPLTSSPLQTNSLQLIVHPTSDMEGQDEQEQEQEQERTAGPIAVMGLGTLHRMRYNENSQRESASTTDDAEQEITDPYETAFMELRILRLSSRRLLNAVLKLSRSEQHGQMTRDAELDDQMAVRIFDIQTNLEATTNTMSRLYVITGYKSNRFRRAEPLGRTRDYGLRSVDKTGQHDDKGATSEASSSQGDGTEPWDSDSPTLHANTSADTLAASAPPKAMLEDVSARRTLRCQWRIFWDNLRDASFQDILNMVILFVVVELAMQATRGIYHGWATYEFWPSKDVRYQCWEAV